MEEFVNQLLLEKGISTTSQLNIRDLAEAFDLEVFYWNCRTCYMDGAIIVDIEKEPIVQYEEFLHELAHVIYPVELETFTDFERWRYIERKVNAIVPYIAVPKFALNLLYKAQTIEEASEMFGVSHQLIYKRLRLMEMNKYKLTRRGEYHGWSRS